MKLLEIKNFLTWYCGLSKLHRVMKNIVKREKSSLNYKITKLISEHTIFDEQRLWEIFKEVKSFDKLFCIMDMSIKFHIDLNSARDYILYGHGGRFNETSGN